MLTNDILSTIGYIIGYAAVFALLGAIVGGVTALLRRQRSYKDPHHPRPSGHTSLKVWIALGLLGVLVLSAGAGAVMQYVRAERLDRQLHASQAQAAALEREKEAAHRARAAAETATDECRSSEALSDGFASFFIDKFQEIDAILTKADSDAIDLINWQVDNCQYYGNAYDQALVLHGRFLAQHEQTLADYERLVAEIEDLLLQLEDALGDDSSSGPSISNAF